LATRPATSSANSGTARSPRCGRASGPPSRGSRRPVADLKPAPDGGVGARFAALVRRYRLDARERDLLLAGICDAHELLEYGLDERRCCGNFLLRLEEAAAYLGCGADDVLPLVRNGSKLVAGGLLDSDLRPSRETLEYLEGRSAAPAMKVNWFVTDAPAASGDERFDGLDYFAG